MFTDEFTDAEMVVIKKHHRKEKLTSVERRLIKRANWRADRTFLTDIGLLMLLFGPVVIFLVNIAP